MTSIEVAWLPVDKIDVPSHAFYCLDSSNSVNLLKERTALQPNTTMKVLTSYLKAKGIDTFCIDFINWTQRYATPEDQKEYLDSIIKTSSESSKDVIN